MQVSRSLPTDSPQRDQVIQYRDVGTKLTVRPTINQDGYVSLLIQQEINQATTEVQFDAPVISTREAVTQVLVRNAMPCDHVDERREDPPLRGTAAEGRIEVGAPLVNSATAFVEADPGIVRQVVGVPHEGVQHAHVAEQPAGERQEREVEVSSRAAGEGLAMAVRIRQRRDQ